MDIFVRRASPAERYSLLPLALVADTYGPVNAQKPSFSFCWRRNIMASAAVTNRSGGDCGRILSAVYILFIRGLSPCEILKSLKNMRQERSPHANQNSSCPRHRLLDWEPDAGLHRYSGLFLLGCMEPDYNLATYLRGLKGHGVFHGHNADNSFAYVSGCLRSFEKKRPWLRLGLFPAGGPAPLCRGRLHRATQQLLDRRPHKPCRVRAQAARGNYKGAGAGICRRLCGGCAHGVFFGRAQELLRGRAGAPYRQPLHNEGVQDAAAHNFRPGRRRRSGRHKRKGDDK